MSLAALILELNLLLALLGATLAMLRSGSVAGRRTYAGLALAGAAWCAGELLVDRSLADAWTGMRLSMLGLVLVGPFWLGVAVHMAALPLARRLPWFPAALAVPGLMLWSLLFLDPWSAAVMRGPHEPGPLWWVYSIFSYLLIILGIGVHVWSGLRQSDRRQRAQTIAIGLSGLLPLGTHVAYAALGFPWAFDPTPMTLTPSGVALASALFPGGLLDVRPVAQQELIERLPLGVVMADRSGAVFDVNPHAQRVLGVSRNEALGRALDAIVAEAPVGYRVELSEVQLASRVVARFAFLHPPEGAGRRKVA